MEKILKIENVSKTYKRNKVKVGKSFKTSQDILAVSDVSFEIKEGEIYGLLGPNGAGKSTIIKMIAGLISKDSGKIYIGDVDIDADRQKATSMIGAIIESPAMFKNMSAIDNLRYFATLAGGKTDEAKILAALDTVGLADRAKDKVQTYSLGMKQRLGIAQAIMSKPKLLILDEPTNGLDPEWIISTRELLKRLAHDYNVAVLVSSHILLEMQELCDRIGILYNGKLIKEATIEELDQLSVSDRTIASYEVDNIVKAYDIISGMFEKVVIKNSKIFVEINEADIPALTRKLILEDINVYGVERKKKNLEDVFKNIVSEVKRQESEVGGEADASKML